MVASVILSAWRTCDVDPGAGEEGDLCRGLGEGWIAVEAPGDIYRALVAAGRLSHPYQGRGEAAAEWVRHREWWWHTRFHADEPASGETSVLRFDGLDTFAEIFLDGALIGTTDNMFRSWRFDVSDRIAPGPHDLAIRFHPTAPMVAGDALPTWRGFPDRISQSRRTLMRKAQFGWGWDWGPDLPTVGIWQPVRLERHAGPVVSGLNFTTLSIDGDSASVRVDVEVTGDADVSIRLTDPDGNVVAETRRRGSGAVRLTIAEPRLWWTADLGDQPLYALAAVTSGGELHRKVGIRTLALDQSPDPDEPGCTFFRFILNNVPIFAKGASWIPADSFVGAIPDARYRDLLERALDANMNMIRVWGGGIYEPDIFYDECDRLGLLVWQDFMFACAPYPTGDAFLANVRAEVAEQARRLRTHPCLALWCGNNENQGIQFFDNLHTGRDDIVGGIEIYEQLIPEALATLDPETPYWPGSPWGGPSPNSMRAGDVHDWTVWHGIPLVSDAEADGPFDRSPESVAFTRYAEDKARFVSEFGIQAAPELATLERWMAPEDLALGTQGFLDRIKDIADKASAMMLPVTGLPGDIVDYVDFTMLTQAEGLKFGIEHFRRRAPHCSGALIWQYNDCWPCVSWSLVDYDGFAKSSFFATKRAFAPVLASFRLTDGGETELWITNDSSAGVRDEVVVSREHVRDGTAERVSLAVDVPPHSSSVVWRGRFAPDRDHIVHIRSANEAFPPNRLALVAVKDIDLSPDPGLSVVWSGARLEIVAERYALAVKLSAADTATRFDDNHFDLAAGERRTIAVPHASGQPIGPIAVTSWNSRKSVVRA